MYNGKRIAVLIAAAGLGTRMGGISKQYIRIGDEMILGKSLKVFSGHPFIDDIYLVVKKEDMEFCRNEFANKKGYRKIRAIISGGKHRQSSVYNGLKVINGCRRSISGSGEEIPVPDYVFVHDGARPFVSAEEISRLTDAVFMYGAATLGIPVKDTVARVKDMLIRENLDRESLCLIQTPQGFIFSSLLEAHKKAQEDKYRATDDSGLVQLIGTDVVLVPGNERNIKITTPDDLKLARLIEAEISEYASVNPPVQDFRIGTGFDVHAFAEDRQLILGGVEIPWEKGLSGHSDADVLIHAIMDAILGACGLGDIGTHFPDNDPRFEGISSMKLLAEINSIISAASFEIGNIDAVVVAERPKVSPYIKEIKENIAEALGLKSAKINIKATTTEGLGFCGREEGIAAMASAAILRKI